MGIFSRIFGRKTDAVSTRSSAAAPRWTMEIDGTLPSTEAAVPWVVYAGSKTQLRDGVHPQQAAGTLPASVNDFEEECVAPDDAAEFCQIQPADKPVGDAYMRFLVDVRAAGLMREYVWRFLRRADWPEPSGLQMDRLASWLEQRDAADHVGETRATISRAIAE